MLQGSKLGRELLRLLNDLDLAQPVRVAQFLTGDYSKAAKEETRVAKELRLGTVAFYYGCLPVMSSVRRF